jgi:hypothetical protein
MNACCCYAVCSTQLWVKDGNTIVEGWLRVFLIATVMNSSVNAFTV